MITSTGGLCNASTANGSTTVRMFMERDSTGAITSPHDEPVVTSTSTGGATLAYGGVVALNTSATAATFNIGITTPPRIGQGMELYVQSSASALVFGGTSTAILFYKVGSGSPGSTTLTLTDANLGGQALYMRCFGVSSSAYRIGVTNGSTVIQA